MRALSARRVRPVFIAALALLSALAFASTAHAGTMTFSSPYPAANATGVSGWPNMSVRVQSTAAIPLPQTMLVDGLPVTCYGYYAEVSGHMEYDPNLEEDVWVVDEWDYTDLTLYSLGAMLTDTVHTAQVDIVDSEDDADTYSWSFTVAQAPSLWSVSPSQLTSSTTPAIRLPIWDNGGSHTCTLTVAGVSVPVTQVGNEFRGTVATPLPDGMLANASATITDQGGRSSTHNWTFRVFTAAQVVVAMTPADGSAQTAYPTVVCTGYDLSTILYMDFVVDGRAPVRVWPTKIDATHWRSSWYAGVLGDGSHTVTCTITDALGNRPSFSRTFTVNQSPSLYSLTPLPGSRVTTSQPQIVASWSDNSSTWPTAQMTVDGIAVTASASALGQGFVYRPSQPLTEEATHTVQLTIRDAAGNQATSNWSFWVDRYLPMPMNACTECHAVYPATHNGTGCYDCHGDAHGDLDCEDCHGAGYHDFSACERCHSTQVQYAHEDMAGRPHNSTQSFDACDDCHTSSLTREHNRYRDASNDPLDCQACHATTASARIKAAIVANNTRCDACHDNSDHVAMHVSPTAGCFGTGCHPASKNLYDVHALYAGPGSERPQFATACDLCHDNPGVNTATSGTACTGTCHSAVTHSGRTAGHTTTAASASCTDCHGADIVEVHGAYTDLSHCAWCHERADTWSRSGDCLSCHGDGHPHPAADVSALANGERACSDCHSADIVAEHAKATSSSAAAACDACHASGGPRDQIGGSWDLSCSTPACHAAGSSRAVHDNYCIACHADTQPDFATSELDFAAAAPVDRESACRSCHVSGLVGTHPLHQQGSNCGAACHPGWGNALMTATPLYTDPTSGASFATVGSKSTPPALLHVIHATPRWPQGAMVSGPDGRMNNSCASCHASAACNSCHTASVSHETHSSVGGAGLTAYEPWTGKTGYGVFGGDLMQETASVDSNQCASAACHDVAASATRSPRALEDFNYAVGGNPDEPTGMSSAISVDGVWRMRASARYSAGRMSYNNVAGSSFSATFTGTRVDIVSDKDPYRGTAEVLIDGAVVGSFDSYAAVTKYQAVVFSADVEAGNHTVTVRPLGRNVSARGSYIVVDTFRTYSQIPDSISPACSSCHSDRVADHW